MNPQNAGKFFDAAGELGRPHSSSDAGEDPSEREADQASEPVPSSAPPGTAVGRTSSAIGTSSSSSSLTADEPASVAMFRFSSSSSDSSPTSLSPDLFEAAVMRAVHKDLMKMIVVELKRELEARAEPKTGSKAWLRRRLHAAIVREHLDASGQ